MKASDIPTKIVLPFAGLVAAPFVRNIPLVSQIGIEDGAASFQTGFPPDTFTPVSAGGTPPFGEDFNGLARQITAWSRWQAAGGVVFWDAAFSAAVGGYPAGSIVAAQTLGQFWFCVVDDNVTDPGAGGAGWINLFGDAQTISDSVNHTLTILDCNVGFDRLGGALALGQQITLPLGVIRGQKFTLSDLAGNFSGFPVTVIPQPASLIAGVGNFVMDVDRGSWTFTWIGGPRNQWSVGS